MGIAIALVAFVAAAAAFVAARPSRFRIMRSRTMAAPPEILHAFVNDFHKWTEWSPWEKLDPNLQREYTGPPAGVGASYHWVGNNKVGEGRMTITESQAPDSVIMRLEFLKPWKATNTTQFEFVPDGSGAIATWAMTGDHNFMLKAVNLLMNMDKMVGPDFEKGLANLDAATAGSAKLPAV